VIAVSRFSEAGLKERLESWGVETFAGDLLDERFVASLPDVPLVVYLAGFKFGASSDPAQTWAMNCYAPSLVCRKFAGSRIVAFSTGNVYGMVPVRRGGSQESDPPRPVGEYAMATLGRERIFEYFSRQHNLPLALLRLNYASEMRYGVLVDLALAIRAGQPIDLAMGYVNVIWQADANAMALAALAHASSPPLVVNVAGPETLRVRDACQSLASLMNTHVEFLGDEGSEAFLSDGRLGYELLGRPELSVERLIDWTADWIARGGPTLGKPTKFQSRDGRF
jgi:nucleoside-diphosphate-sugar epimerase